MNTWIEQASSASLNHVFPKDFSLQRKCWLQAKITHLYQLAHFTFKDCWGEC